MEQQGVVAAENEPERLVLAHMHLVRIIASKLYRLRWSTSVGFDEYCQMGALGLVEAARRFDSTRGAAFNTFASWRITGAILNGLVRSTEQHQQAASRKRIVDARVASVSEDDDAPHDPSVQAALSRLADVAVGLAVGFMLEGSGMFDDGQATTPMDGYASLALRQMRGRLRAAVAGLPQAERRVLEGHYFQQQPFAEIAEALGVTRGRVSQIHKRGLGLLRAELARDNPVFEA
jgi:RNA polymerase sigma factor for flagellar operon FliA